MKPIYWPEIDRYDNLSSTQDRARQLAQDSAPEGTVVTATTQTDGRGRLGRIWVSPGGGLWFSLVLRPRVSPAEAPALNLLAAVAVTEALRSVTGLEAGIKWPNDVLVEGRKLAGILMEMKTGSDGIEYVLVGVGVNANIDPAVMPSDLRLPVATILGETGRQTDLENLLDTILASFWTYYENWPNHRAGVLSRWRELSVTLGRRVTISSAGRTVTGSARDINSDGSLIVVDAAGAALTVHAGDLTLQFD